MEPWIIGIVLIVLSVLCAALTSRAWRAKGRAVRWLGVPLGMLLTVGLGLVGAVDLRGVYLLNAPRGNPVSDVKVVPDPERLERGERLAHLCASCHSTTSKLPLDGGRESLLSSPTDPGLGMLYPPNLTPGGPLREWTDGEIIRAIREGFDKNGHALLIMPADGFHSMSDADVQAIVAYLRSQPAIARSTPPRSINLLGTMLIGAGLLPTAAQPPITGPVAAPPAGTSPESGRYLVSIAGCRVCHGQNLEGRQPDRRGPPAGPSLAVVSKWNEADFVRTIRTGVDPSGHALRSELMPWRQFTAAFSDDDMKSIYAYLRGLQPTTR